MTHAATAYIALGANLAEPRAQVRGGIEALSGLPDSQLEVASDLYRTAPVGVHGQPDFINAVARVRTTLSPHALLVALFAIEARFGRDRDRPLAPRTLDLDLLLYDELALALPGPPALVLPHPRMHLRAFVLAPLVAIAPAVTIPGRGKASAWLPAVAGQAIERLA